MMIKGHLFGYRRLSLFADWTVCIFIGRTPKAKKHPLVNVIHVVLFFSAQDVPKY